MVTLIDPQSVTKTPINRTAPLALVTLFAALAVASAAEVSVKIQPNSFPVGRGGQLSVTVTGGNFDSPPNPQAPDGVTIRSYGRNQSVQIINGRVNQSITQNFIISANEPGTYTIPSFEVVAGGKKTTTDPVSFTVTTAAAPPSLSTPPVAGNPSQGAGGTAAAADSFLKLEFPPRKRDYLYVGEMAPVRIKAYFPPGAKISLRSAPRPEGEGFTLHHLSKEPEQDFEVVNGTKYRTVSWFAGISTVKAGHYPIHIGLDATVMTPERSRTRRMRPPSLFGGSLFDDPFFDNFFDSAFTHLVPHDVTLTTNGDPLDIRSLPAGDRPKDFSGAVGNFSLGSYRLPADATIGEPRKIRVTIEGRGNFDRMSAPILEPAAHWKTYTAKTEFKPEDVTSFSGSKTFEFNAVPQRGGDQQVQLTFSYFDPSEGAYKSLSSPTIPLKVAGSAATPPPPTATQPAASAAAAQTPAVPSTESGKTGQTPVDLAPSRLTLGTDLPLLTAPGLLAVFWLLVGLGVLLIVAGFVIRAVRRRNADPQRVAARKSARAESAALTEADAAARNGDVIAFFNAARRAVQTRFAAAWHCPAESLTIAELRHRLPADSAALTLLRQADAIAYAPAQAGDAFDAERWQPILQRALVESGPGQVGPSPEALPVPAQ